MVNKQNLNVDSFANINPEVSNDQIKTFSKLIERLTGETYNNIEVIKSVSI